MSNRLVHRIDVVCGFAFDIEKTANPERPSGFKPAGDHLGSIEQNPIYAQPRIEGFAAMLRLGFCRMLVIPGKDERRYKGETIVIDGKPSKLWQGWVIREMLIHDLGADPSKIHWLPSTGTTGNAAIAFLEFARREHLSIEEGEVEFVTSWYHCPRAGRIALRSAGLPPFLTPAEAFTLAEAELDGNREAAEQRLRSFGGHFTDSRVIQEIRGVALFLLGKDRPQTKGW